jgi:hypothetical protein
LLRGAAPKQEPKEEPKEVRTDPENRNAPFSFAVLGSLFPIRARTIAPADR